MNEWVCLLNLRLSLSSILQAKNEFKSRPNFVDGAYFDVHQSGRQANVSTIFSERSVVTPELFFGHDTQSMPAA